VGSWPSSAAPDHRVEADGRQVDRVRELTGGTGVEAVLDFVGEDDTVQAALAMLAPVAATTWSASVGP
jgi:NAD+-dependent secondary alcohol dehydrogenase Adh1